MVYGKQTGKCGDITKEKVYVMGAKKNPKKTKTYILAIELVVHPSEGGMRRAWTNFLKRCKLVSDGGGEVGAWSLWDDNLQKTGNKLRKGAIHIDEGTLRNPGKYHHIGHEIRHFIDGHFHNPQFKKGKERDDALSDRDE